MVCSLSTETVPSIVSFFSRTVSSESEARVAPDATVTFVEAVRMWMDPVATLKEAVSDPVTFSKAVATTMCPSASMDTPVLTFLTVIAESPTLMSPEILPLTPREALSRVMEATVRSAPSMTVMIFEESVPLKTTSPAETFPYTLTSVAVLLEAFSKVVT